MLKVNDLNAYYGESHILFDINLDVQKGEIVSLLGRNGVGKSTTLKAIMGEVHRHGSIMFKDDPMVGLPPYVIARRGLGYVPENRDIFPTLTVRQNLIIGMKGGTETSSWTIEDMFNLFPILKLRADVLGGNLSGGEQQMLAICRTLMGNPDLIMIDEPTEGLAPKIVQVLAEMFEEIKNRDVSILLVEQKLTIVLKISQRLYVMGHGHIVFEGTTKEFIENEGIRRTWLEV
jgi:branched-chain amino acid transport system ATP-binding protein